MDAHGDGGKEEEIKNRLLRDEAELWGPFRSARVSDQAEVCCCWKPVRPFAEYDLTKARKKKKPLPPAVMASSTSVVTEETPNPRQYSYMSGELDENFAYVYNGGLSARAGAEYCEAPCHGNTFSAALAQKYCARTIVLEPSMLPTHSSHQVQAERLAKNRAELAKILAIQLKPELLVEQLIIENRLRTMSLSAFPVLEDLGVGKKSVTTHSRSTPALGGFPNTHVHYRPKKHSRKMNHCASPKRCMQWCSLSNKNSEHHQVEDSESLDDQTLQRMLSYQGLKDHTHNEGGRNSLKESHRSGVHSDHSSHQLPVVAPYLAPKPDATSKKQHRLNPLLFSPEESGTSRHRGDPSSNWWLHSSLNNHSKITYSMANSKRLKFN